MVCLVDQCSKGKYTGTISDTLKRKPLRPWVQERSGNRNLMILTLCFAYCLAETFSEIVKSS